VEWHSPNGSIGQDFGVGIQVLGGVGLNLVQGCALLLDHLGRRPHFKKGHSAKKFNHFT